MNDTTEKAQKVQVEIFRNMRPEQRLIIGLELSNTALELLKVGIKLSHPEYSETEIDMALKKLILPEELYKKVYLHK